MITVKMSAEEYQQHCDDSDGVCLECGAVSFGGTEPDAENYPCEECGESQVQGIENCMIDGTIEITEDGDEPSDES